MSLFSRDLLNLHHQMNSMFDTMHDTYGSNSELDAFSPVYGLPLIAASSVQPKDESALILSDNSNNRLSNRFGLLNNKTLSMSVDMHALPDSYKVTCELPGVDKASIDVSADKKNHVLSIKAEKRSEFSSATDNDGNRQTEQGNTKQRTQQSTSGATSTINQSLSSDATNVTNQSKQLTPQNTDTKVTRPSPRVIHQERSYGMVQRSIRLANDADLDHIDAKYENGVLVLNVPRMKRAEQPAKKIQVQ